MSLATLTWLCPCGWDNCPVKHATHCRNCGRKRVGNEDRDWPSAYQITQVRNEIARRKAESAQIATQSIP